jgi:hypothetical protein
MNVKHDQLGEAIEAQVVKQLRQRAPNGESILTAADLKALAGALLNAQRLRRIALGADIESEAAAARPFVPPIIVYHQVDPERVRAERDAAERGTALPADAPES